MNALVLQRLRESIGRYTRVPLTRPMTMDLANGFCISARCNLAQRMTNLP